MHWSGHSANDELRRIKYQSLILYQANTYPERKKKFCKQAEHPVQSTDESKAKVENNPLQLKNDTMRLKLNS